MIEEVMSEAGDLLDNLPLSSQEVSQINSQTQSLSFLPTIQVSSPYAGSDSNAVTRQQARAELNDTPFLSNLAGGLGAGPGGGDPDGALGDMNLALGFNPFWIITVGGGLIVFFIFRKKIL